MFLTKADLEEAVRMAEIYGAHDTIGGQKQLAQHFAKEIFSDFNEMDKEEQKEAIDLVLEDIELDIYNLN